MPHNRFWVDAIPQVGSSCCLEGKEAHHLLEVMRRAKETPVELVDGSGRLARARLVASSKRGECQLVVESIDQAAKPTRRLTLLQAIPRKERLDLIIEKATELGVDEICLFPGARSERKELSESHRERLHRLAIAAVKQSGRLHMPSIALYPAIGKWSTVAEGQLAFFGEVGEGAVPLLSLLERQWKQEVKQLFCAIGPEGGFTDQEEELMRRHGFYGASLHPLVLRTDTAPLLALSLISHWLWANKKALV